jgi:peptidoglycan/xylan/chitin deacetylase (PgdA/CDA1 family)
MPSREQAAAGGMKTLRMLDAERGRQTVDAMLAAIPVDRLARLKERFASERFLNWPQVAELAGRGVEIGAHAHYHWPMHRGRSATEIALDVRAAKARIENQIGPCRYFAYPVGNTADVSREAWQAVRDAGFSHAFTTLAGSLDGGANPWLLPRYALQQTENALGALAPMLRIANPRLAFWQKRLA